MRIVTLLPSATETVCALGVDPVGVTHECDYPPRVADLPAVVHSAVDTTGTSEAIDREVQAATAGDGVYDLDAETLEELDPDAVVTQGICDVCAVDEAVVRETIADLGLDAELVATHPRTLEDVFDDLERLGRVVGKADEAAGLRADLEARVESVRERVAEAPTRPSVVVLDWLDPAMVGGHWVPELIEMAGGDPLLAEAGRPSGPVEWDAVREADPDVLVAAPCGFPLAQTAANAADLTERPGWSDLTAVRESRVYAVDGNHYVNRPGPRLVETLELFAAMLHPEAFGDATDVDPVRSLAELAASA